MYPVMFKMEIVAIPVVTHYSRGDGAGRPTEVEFYLVESTSGCIIPDALVSDSEYDRMRHTVLLALEEHRPQIYTSGVELRARNVDIGENE